MCLKAVFKPKMYLTEKKEEDAIGELMNEANQSPSTGKLRRLAA